MKEGLCDEIRFTKAHALDTILLIMIELTKKYKSGSAAEILQEAILTGDIPPGISLTQNELANSLGTSRMPVREALIILEYQGLILRHTNQHVQIASLSDEHIHSIFADMAMLETEAISSFTPHTLNTLSSCETQELFHPELCRCVEAPLRRKILETLTGVYASFVFTHSEEPGRVSSVFGNIKSSLTSPPDMSVIRSAYTVYSKVLASELIRIRRNRHAQSQAR